MRWLLFSAQGRLSRKPYWLFILAAFIVQYALFLIADAGELLAYISTFIYLAVVVVSVLVAIKRCHDRARSGWFLLVGLVPILNLWPVIELGFFRGTIGSNKYGQDQLEKLTSTSAS